MKRAAKIICFLVLLGGAYWYADGVMQIKMDSALIEYRRFYKLKKNTLDVLILGSSRAFCDINPAIMWIEKGILSYHLSTSAQPFWISYYNLIECLKYQNPKVIVLETSAATWGIEYQDLGRAYISTYTLRLSKNKINSVASAIQSENFFNLLFGFPIVHARRDITRNDFVDPYKNKAYPNGYIPRTGNQISEEPKIDTIKDSLPIPYKQLAYFMKILNLAKENNIPLLLFVAPYVLSENEQRHFNTVKQIAAEYNIRFVNYNLFYDELGLGFGKDLGDWSHLNVKGAAKLTRHLTNILATEYGLPDRRQDPAYAEWNTWAEQVMAELPN
jgi:hypothetical protein